MIAHDQGVYSSDLPRPHDADGYVHVDAQFAGITLHEPVRVYRLP
jgi:hypothetical protein